MNKNMLKPHSHLTPCLGAGMVARTNKSVSECVFLHYEDFNKLVYFANKQVSSFVEDLVQYITIGLVSPKSVETYLGHLRNPENENKTFSSVTTCKNIQDFLIVKKMEQLKRPWLRVEPIVNINHINSKAIVNKQWDF